MFRVQTIVVVWLLECETDTPRLSTYMITYPSVGEKKQGF
jgi:hypothetical protein